jgi:putative addiction module component (TIGR02574 family)
VASIDIAQLSAEEQMRLLDQLWDNLAKSPDAFPLTSTQRQELDRRLDDLDQDDPSGIPWEEVLHQIRKRSL